MVHMGALKTTYQRVSFGHYFHSRQLTRGISTAVLLEGFISQCWKPAVGLASVYIKDLLLTLLKDRLSPRMI